MSLQDQTAKDLATGATLASLGISRNLARTSYAPSHINSIDNYAPLTTLVEVRNTLLWHFIRP